MADHPHIFVSRKGRNIPYRGITPNIQVVRVQRENRRAHTEELVQAVEAAVERNAEQVLLPEEERGFYLLEELAFEHFVWAAFPVGANRFKTAKAPKACPSTYPAI